MVEENRPPDSQPPGGDRASWFSRLLLSLVGFSAIINGLLGRGTRRVPVGLLPPPSEHEVHYPDGRIENPTVSFEKRDAQFGCILAILIAAMILAGLLFWIILWFVHDYERYQADIKRSPFPLAPTLSDTLPAEPRLEQLDRVSVKGESSAYARELINEQHLHSYGGPSEGGYIRIPIDRAMDVLAKRGLPARKQSPKEDRKANGLVDSGESNSGRMYREKPQWFER
jgi:hypothetical protein